MLTKLVLINSSSYKIAELNFEGSRSLQLVGPNNVGKSSLIYALNFVFLVNKKLMNFSGQRPADKETIAHYFPDAERSYIVFEVSKRGRRYCVLVRRDGEAELHYARLETAYQKDLFFEPTSKGQKLRNYRELARRLISERQVRLKELPQATDVLRQIYHTGKGNNAAVWLTPKCKSSGTTNSFTKAYRYLINSKLVTNRALKDILLIANNRDQDQLSYSRQNMQDIDRLRRESQKLAILRSIEEEFRQFRLLTGEVQEVYDNLARQFRLYRQAATALAAELADKIYHKEKEAGELKLQARELEQQKGEQNQEVGILRHRMQSLREKLRQEEQTQKAIQALPPLPLLQQQLQSAREALEKLSYRLQEARRSGKSPEELAAEIADLESEQARISQLLEAIRNRAALEKQHDEALEQQKKLEDDIGLASRMGQVGQEIKRLKKELDKLAGEKEKTEKKLRQLAEAIERLDTGRQVLQEQIAALRQEEANLRRDQRELEGMDLEHFVLEKEVEGGAKDARNLFQDIRQNHDKYKRQDRY